MCSTVKLAWLKKHLSFSRVLKSCTVWNLKHLKYSFLKHERKKDVSKATPTLQLNTFTLYLSAPTKNIQSMFGASVVPPSVDDWIPTVCRDS